MSDLPPLDVRAPRFGAWVSALLLAAAIVTGLADADTRENATAFGWFAYQPIVPQDLTVPLLAWRGAAPGFLILAVVASLFLWGVVSPRTHPVAQLYRRIVAPRLRPATDFEDPRPPRFAQGVGLFVTGLGLVLHLLGVPYAVPAAAAVAFVAAFLNAAFGFCLGCVTYLALQRIRPRRAA